MNIITTPLNNGRLGNMLFQVANCLSVAKKHNAQAIFPEWEYNKYFKNKLPTGNVEPTHYYTEPHFHYTPIDLNDSIEKTYTQDKIFNLAGYFQGSKYWEDCTRLIKEQFEPSEELKEKLKGIILDLPVAFNECCSIHVRRGDYVNNSYYAQLDMSYYTAAMDYIKQKCPYVSKFYVFSDDAEWCKQHFPEECAIVEGDSDIEDLFLQSICTHNVIANSSFSWWASYLNKNENKITVAPSKDKWFGPDVKLNVDDLYCKEWICL